MGLGAILNGHTNEMLGLNKNISEVRIKVCRSCPLYKRSVVLGEICNSKVWYNPETGDISNSKKDGYINGCGCRLRAKTTLPGAFCPIGKW
nr:MAG TPA: 14-3-3 protein gamma [Caudoviricetes sp.]